MSKKRHKKEKKLTEKKDNESPLATDWENLPKIKRTDETFELGNIILKTKKKK